MQSNSDRFSYSFRHKNSFDLLKYIFKPKTNNYFDSAFFSPKCFLKGFVVKFWYLIFFYLSDFLATIFVCLIISYARFFGLLDCFCCGGLRYLIISLDPKGLLVYIRILYWQFAAGMLIQNLWDSNKFRKWSMKLMLCWHDGLVLIVILNVPSVL